MQHSLVGRTAFVTDVSLGIGKHTAVRLAELGATVVGVAGDREHAPVLKQEIRRVTGNQDVEVLAGDMASLDDVHRVAKDFGRRSDRLHVLVNGVGAMFGHHQLTEEGVERTFAVNYLSTFLLTNLLTDLLRADAPARIVNVCGNAHRGGHLNFDDLQGAQGYRSAKAYAQAQLALVVFTYELAGRLDGSGITVNCVDPGSIDPLVDGGPARALRAAVAVHRPLPRSARRAARRVVQAAADPALDGISAEFFNKAGVQARTSNESYDPAAARQLWKVSEDLTGLAVP